MKMFIRVMTLHLKMSSTCCLALSPFLVILLALPSSGHQLPPQAGSEIAAEVRSWHLVRTASEKEKVFL